MEKNKLFDQKEIRSHSSWKTNDRLDKLFMRAAEWETECFISPTLPNNKAYFSTVKTIMNATFFIFQEDEIKKLVELRNSWFKDFFSLGEAKEPGEKLFRMVLTTEELFQRIMAYLQRQNYFFRVGDRELKGIDNALRIMDEGGGVFGNKKVPGMDEEEHAPE